MRIDPEATLRCWAVDVEVAGQVYTIPSLPAQAWILAAHKSWADIVPGMLADAEDLTDLIIDGTVTHEECVRAARDAIEAASGTRWWSAARLAQCAGGPIGAELMLRGVDAERVPFGAWCLAAYRVCTRDAKPEDVAKVDMELDTPPSDLDPDEWWDDDAARDQFAAAMGSM